MRERLAQLTGRHRFRGVVVRTGLAPNGRFGTKETLLLTNLCLAATNQQLADHVWMNLTQGFGDAALIGDVIEFDARVDTYEKGYKGGCFDYRLTRPTKVSRVREPLGEAHEGGALAGAGATIPHSSAEPWIATHDLLTLLNVKRGPLEKALKHGWIEEPAKSVIGTRQWPTRSIPSIRAALIAAGIAGIQDPSPQELERLRQR